ncbi:MAG TPA: hypothetical protein VJU18_18560 [Vicinamibacteria bacterium]|nr:hypothetical protein [Vicinamibacteria bacterium]
MTIGGVALLAFLGVVMSVEAGDASRSKVEADWVFRRGQVFVAKGRARASGLAIAGERVLAVGSDAEMAPFVGPRTEWSSSRAASWCPASTTPTSTSWTAALVCSRWI